MAPLAASMTRVQLLDARLEAPSLEAARRAQEAPRASIPRAMSHLSRTPSTAARR
jgi:hypothetical protein